MDLTGIWKQVGGSPADAGTYYIRQAADSAGNQNIYWYGHQASGDAWANSCFGTINNGNQIGCNWADLPNGGNSGTGAITLKIVDENTIEYVDGTGSYFGGRKWVRS